MKNSERIEKIRAYLTGEMSEAEKNEFERLLLDPNLSLEDRTKLQDEMELQKEIILAIRRRGLKEMLRREEAKIKHEEAEGDKVAVRIVHRYRHLVRAGVSSVIAACFVGLLIIGPQASRLATISNDAALFAAANVEMNEAYSGIKGCDEASEAIMRANELMAAGEYKQADKELAQALEPMADVTAEAAQAWTEKEDMTYLRALCAIKQHKLYRSRRLLNEVVNMNSTHKEEAEQLLRQIKGRK
jgi:hypothetical protein